MGSILKRFDRPSSRTIESVKSTPEHDAKSLHDSVAATLRMFMEDDQKKAKLAADKREMQARERISFRAKNQEVLAGIFKRGERIEMTRGGASGSSTTSCPTAGIKLYRQ